MRRKEATTIANKFELRGFTSEEALVTTSVQKSTSVRLCRELRTHSLAVTYSDATSSVWRSIFFKGIVVEPSAKQLSSLHYCLYPTVRAVFAVSCTWYLVPFPVPVQCCGQWTRRRGTVLVRCTLYSNTHSRYRWESRRR